MRRLFWVTGFPGAGKTTFAKKLITALRNKERQPILIDGDEIRKVLSNGSFDASDRKQLSFVYANLAINFYQQGFDVIVATVSMFEAVRKHIKVQTGSRIVFLEPDLAHLKQVNQKGLYAELESIEDAYSKIYPGYELPQQPDWHVTDVNSVDTIINELVVNDEREQE